MWEWLWWTGLITFSLLIIESLFVFDFFLVLLDRDHRHRRRWSGSASSASRRSSRPTSSSWPASATSRKQKFADPEATIKKRGAGGRRRSASSAAGARRTGHVPIEIRRFGVGHRRPDGPTGSVGLTGQVIHSDGRGTCRELAFARNARIEPHANPNTTCFIVVEGGGWVGVGDECTRIAAGEAAVWPADIPHAAWTEHSEMRAHRRRVRRSGRSRHGRGSRPRRRRRSDRPVGRGRRPAGRRAPRRRPHPVADEGEPA